jgi:capsular exopolysaccharide synthesis family protein
LAQLKYKVLLVDTDIRRGRLHESFGKPNQKGLGHFLTANLAFKDVVQPADIEGVSIVTCGSSPIDSSHLFNSAKMDDFVSEARKHFDIIIYDTPPINVISDALILIPRLQSCLFVTRSGVTNSVMLSRAVSLVQESKAKLLGVVLNAADTGHMMTYHQYYKSYQKQSSA